jgi:hypothetical protein
VSRPSSSSRHDAPIAWGGTAIGILGLILAAILLPTDWWDLALLVLLAVAVIGAVWYWHRYQRSLDRKFLGIVCVATIPLLVLVGRNVSPEPGPVATPAPTFTATPTPALPTATSMSRAETEPSASPTAAMAIPTPTPAPTPEVFEQLRAGMNIEIIEQRFGTAVWIDYFGSYTSKVYRDDDRDRWIQAVHDSSGKTLLLALTACDRSDRLPVTGPDGHELVLNQSTFADAGGGVAMAAGTPVYRIGAHDFFAFEGRYFGNVSGYKSWLVGTSDLCPSASIDFDALREGMLRTGVGEVPSMAPQENWETDPDLAAFRASTPVNIYAETAPYISLEEVEAYPLIGFLRYTARTLP